MNREFDIETRCVHGGYEPEGPYRPIAPPLYLTNAYDLGSVEEARGLFALEREGDVYSRISNPTNAFLERRLADLEGGAAAVAFASGHAAIFGVMATLCRAGDEIVASSSIYGGAINLLGVTLREFGILTRFADVNDPESFARLTNPKTRAWFAESVGNPTAAVADVRALSDLAKAAGVPLVIDSTFTPPTLFQPIRWGADIVVHSSTKYIGGHAAVMGGIAVDSGRFEFGGNPRFEAFNRPDPSYHGKVFARDFGALAFATRLRANALRDIGACASPFNSYMMLIGLETLHLRMERHCANAGAVARLLASHPSVESVSYPLLPESRYYPLASLQFPNGCGAIFSFEIAGGGEAGARFVDRLKLLRPVANVGDTRSIVAHPASTTHSQLSPEQLRAGGITESTIRLSIGIESEADILEDIDRALR